jgi:hypothetical protein
VAFSGAEEFLDKYKDSAKDSGGIGHLVFLVLFCFYGSGESRNHH